MKKNSFSMIENQFDRNIGGMTKLRISNEKLARIYDLHDNLSATRCTGKNIFD